MCDTLLASGEQTADSAVMFAKNSDREPGEAQAVELHQRRDYPPGASLRCSWIRIPQARRTFATVLCRPFWMWGAEMGANEHGLTVGNQAVFTRFDVPEEGLTGMDLVRLALERARTATEAIDVIVDHIERYGQGGRCGWRHQGFRYHSAFAIADPDQAWVLETAGPYWAAKRIRGVWALSNGLTIGSDFDRIADGAVDHAVEKGWTTRERFGFSEAFSDSTMDWLAGAKQRRRCTLDQLNEHAGTLTWRHLAAALRSHHGADPVGGWRMTMPCAHASWQPTRNSGQTVGSLISRLDGAANVHWLTGTSSPCLSVFKPLLVGEPVDVGPAPRGRFDGESLFWRHELLHRRLVGRRFQMPAGLEEARRSMQEQIAQIEPDQIGVEQCSTWWRRHRQSVVRWAEQVEPAGFRPTPFRAFWKMQDWISGVAAEGVVH